MKHFSRLVVPCLALSVVFAACENKEDTTGVNTQARVRFVNAISGVTSNLALTANGSMVGSSQPFGQFGTTCTTLNSGSTTFAFGAANTGGTGISSSLATTTFPLTSGGSFVVIGTGTAASPQLLVLPSTSTTNAATGTANVRFVNATGNSALDVFATSGGTVGTTPTMSNLGTYAAGSFTNISTANNTLVFRNAGTSTTAYTATGLNFQSGGNYTVLLLPSATGTGYQVVTVNGSCT